VSYRYWRIRFGAITGTARFAEVEMRLTAGGADECNGGTAISSTGTAADAFDNNTGTDWVSTTNDSNCWIGYDFGAGNNKAIAEVLLRASSTTLPTGCGSFAIQRSNDNVTWVDESLRYSGHVYSLSAPLVLPVVTSSSLVVVRGGFVDASSYRDAGWQSGLAAARGFRHLSLSSRFAVTEWIGGSYVSIPSNGVINGQVLEGVSPVPYARVMCYNRLTGELIAKVIADASGYFSIHGVDPTPPAAPDLGKYFVVALDPQGGVLYNALIADRVVPQTA
jgi:hypothetical protein